MILPWIAGHLWSSKVLQSWAKLKTLSCHEDPNIISNHGMHTWLLQPSCNNFATSMPLLSLKRLSYWEDANPKYEEIDCSRTCRQHQHKTPKGGKSEFIKQSMDGWLQSRSSYFWCCPIIHLPQPQTWFTWLGEVVDELDGGCEGASGDGVLGDLVRFAVVGSGDQSAAYNASN